MDRVQLLASLTAAAPSADDLIYVQRRGPAYAWHRVEPGAPMPASASGGDVWMYFSGAWPQDDPAALQEFCADMLAEMESMSGGADRCRWPLEQPWPRAH